MNAHRGEPGEDIRAAVHTAHATGRVNAPAAVVDLTAFTANAELLRTCAAGRLIRVATKSVRCRPLLERTLALPGFAGLMAFSLAEALWLADSPDSTFHDVLVAYPSTDRTAWARLTSSATAAQRITVMIDDENQLGDTTDTAARSRSASTSTPPSASARPISGHGARRCGPRSRWWPWPGGWRPVRDARWPG